jgi:hypothetical protein
MEVKKMSAKEMFEKLGYKKRNESNYYTSAVLIYDKEFYRSIYFDNDKTIDASGEILTMNLLQAINKQVEELGWLGSDDNEYICR